MNIMISKFEKVNHQLLGWSPEDGGEIPSPLIGQEIDLLASQLGWEAIGEGQRVYKFMPYDLCLNSFMLEYTVKENKEKHKQK